MSGFRFLTRGQRVEFASVDAPRDRELRLAQEVGAEDFGPAGPGVGESMAPGSAGSFEGTIQTLRDGYGFITSSDPTHRGQTFFFFHAEVLNADFNDLKPGDRVRFQLGTNPRVTCAVQVSTMN